MRLDLIRDESSPWQRIAALGSIVIDAGAELTVFVAGSVQLAGNGMINNARRADYNTWVALDSSTSWFINGNGSFIGIVYAPNATVSFTGGPGDASGAIMAKNIRFLGDTQFHYDEAAHDWGRPWFRMCASDPVEDAISSFQVSETDAVVQFPMSVGKMYFLQSTDNLTTGTWSTVGSTNFGLMTISCTNETLTMRRPLSGIEPQRFYRVLVHPLE